MGALRHEAADFFRKLLKLFGIDGGLLIYGELKGTLQHATVVVPVQKEKDATPVFALFDPTFGAVLRQSGNQLGSLDQLILSWGTPAAEDFRVETTDLSARTWLDEPSGRPHSCSEPNPEVTACDLDRYLAANGASLRAAGFSTGQRGFLEFLVLSKWFVSEPSGVRSTRSWGAEQSRQAASVRWHWRSAAADGVRPLEGG